MNLERNSVQTSSGHSQESIAKAHYWKQQQLCLLYSGLPKRRFLLTKRLCSLCNVCRRWVDNLRVVHNKSEKQSKLQVKSKTNPVQQTERQTYYKIEGSSIRGVLISGIRLKVSKSMAWSFPLQIKRKNQIWQTEGTKDILDDIVQNILSNVLSILEKHCFGNSLEFVTRNHIVLL